MLHAERLGLFTANREGILSSAGYLSPTLSSELLAQLGCGLQLKINATRPAHAFYDIQIYTDYVYIQFMLQLHSASRSSLVRRCSGFHLEDT